MAGFLGKERDCLAARGRLPPWKRQPTADLNELPNRGLGIREVWVFEAGAFRLLTLRGDHYEAMPNSEVLPQPGLLRIAHFAEQPDQHAALRASRQELHGAAG